MAEESIPEDPTSPGVLASPACKSGSYPESQGPEMPETKFSNCVAAPCDERPGWWRCLGGFPPPCRGVNPPLLAGRASATGRAIRLKYLAFRGPGPAFCGSSWSSAPSGSTRSSQYLSPAGPAARAAAVDSTASCWAWRA